MNRDETKISLDALINLAVTEANQRELAQLPSAQEMDDAFQPSDRLRKKVEHTLRRCRNARLRRIAWGWVRRTAVAAAALWVVFTGALVPAQAVQQAAYSTLLQWKDQFSSLIVSSDVSTVTLLPDQLQITYLPEGYQPDEHSHDSIAFRYKYSNSQSQNLLVQVMSIDNFSQVDFDNEHSDYYTIEFDDISALWVENGSNVTTLVYEKDDFLFYISGSVDLSQLIKIAQGIQY